MSLRRLLYSVFIYLVFPVVLMRLLWRSRKNPEYRRRLPERLTLNTTKSLNAVICVHAVSVGEAIAAKPLIEALFISYPDSTILLTTTTPTGSDRVQAMFADQIQAKRLQHVYFPYDLLGACARFVDAYQPKVLIVVETEIWPNLYAKCYQEKIPVLMVNARLSEKSTQSYLKIKGLIAETLAKVNTIAVRSEIDAKRFGQLGASPNQIKQIGNIKYDLAIDEEQREKANRYLASWNQDSENRKKVFVAASTHKGEDSKIILSYLNLRKQFPNLVLVLVPRHPERFDAVYETCLELSPQDVTVTRRSEFKQKTGSTNQHVTIVLGDSMGEMQLWYALADVVFIGGSLVATGGHNPLEATIFGVPVVSGLHMFNFEDISSELGDAELMFKCGDDVAVSKKVEQLLREKTDSKVYLEKAEKFMQQHRGVTARLLNLVSECLADNK